MSLCVDERNELAAGKNVAATPRGIDYGLVVRGRGGIFFFSLSLESLEV